MDFLQTCWRPQKSKPYKTLEELFIRLQREGKNSYPVALIRLIGTATLRAVPFLLLSCFCLTSELVSLETVVLSRWGIKGKKYLFFFKLVDNTDWFTTVRWIGKLTFRALALRQSESQQRASARNGSFPICLTVRVNIHLSTSLIKPNICLTRERLCMKQVSLLLSMRWMLLGHSFDPRLNQAICLGKSSLDFGF